MPTKWRRKKCHFCKRTVVLWKLVRRGDWYFCFPCIDSLHEWTAQMYKKKPNKALFMQKYNTGLVPKLTKYGTRKFQE